MLGCSNRDSILQAVPEEFREGKPFLELNEWGLFENFGHILSTKNGLISIQTLSEIPTILSPTKRTMLSDIASLCIIVAEIMMQKLWLLGIEWDDPLDSLHEAWMTFRNNLASVEDIIHRPVDWVHCTSQRRNTCILRRRCDRRRMRPNTESNVF